MGQETTWCFMDTDTTLFSFGEYRWIEDLVITGSNIVDQQFPMFEGKISHHSGTDCAGCMAADSAMEDLGSNFYTCNCTDAAEVCHQHF